MAGEEEKVEKVEVENASTTEYLTPEQIVDEIKEDVIETQVEVTSSNPNTAYVDQKLEDIHEKLDELNSRTERNHDTTESTNTAEETEREQEKRPEPRHFWFRKWKFRE